MSNVKLSPMKVREEYAQRLVVETDDPGLSTIVRLVAGLLALVALARLFPFSSSALLMIGSAFALWQIASVMDVQSEAVFDRARGRFTLVHRRKGAVFSRTELALREVEAVVIEARRARRVVSMRPAVVINGRRVPLNHASFTTPGDALQLVQAIRTFIGLESSNVVEDSIRWSTRPSAGRTSVDDTAAILSQAPLFDERPLAADSGSMAMRVP